MFCGGNVVKCCSAGVIWSFLFLHASYITTGILFSLVQFKKNYRYVIYVFIITVYDIDKSINNKVNEKN